jgi:hypothetical protein
MTSIAPLRLPEQRLSIERLEVASTVVEGVLRAKLGRSAHRT